MDVYGMGEVRRCHVARAAPNHYLFSGWIQRATRVSHPRVGPTDDLLIFFYYYLFLLLFLPKLFALPF